MHLLNLSFRQERRRSRLLEIEFDCARSKGWSSFSQWRGRGGWWARWSRPAINGNGTTLRNSFQYNSHVCCVCRSCYLRASRQKITAWIWASTVRKDSQRWTTVRTRKRAHTHHAHHAYARTRAHTHARCTRLAHLQYLFSHMIAVRSFPVGKIDAFVVAKVCVRCCCCCRCWQSMCCMLWPFR